MKIINDSSIIDCTPIYIYNGSMPFRYVLRHVPNQVQPYVTHQQIMKFVDGVWDHDEYCHGHYFSDLDRAKQDYEFRIK